ncbi:MAG: alpha/beta hydrolase [Candidatus Competibacteraceae bacterium]|nr:alpha/beta hydrolase [Candidatus Competibacteraceae bacterium]
MNAVNGGPYKEVHLSRGTIRYREQGAGPPLVFVHGLLVNGDLWRKVVPVLSTPFRCIVPDLPLGSHVVPMASNADMTPLGLACLMADFLDALDLQDVTLIGNDTGGALCQLVTAHTPALTALVLTNCDAFENFYPLALRPLQVGAHIPGFGNLLGWLLRSRWVQRLVACLVSRRQYTLDELDTYFGPFVRSPEVRRDTMHWLQGVSSRYTVEAAERLTTFSRPVLLAWSADDWLFPLRDAERLAQVFPDARLVQIRGVACPCA